MPQILPLELPVNNITPTWVQKVLNLRLRLIPLVLFCAFMLLSVKIYQVLHVFYPVVEIPVLQATKADIPSKGGEEEKTTLNPHSKTEIPDKKSPKIPEDKKENKTSSESDFDPLALTAEKVHVLKTLAKLRKDLSNQEKTLQEKEQFLQVLQKKIDEKLQQLTLIEAKLKETLKTSQKEKEEEMKKIVAIYEKMKPAEAAKILEGLELNVVSNIMFQMKDSKSSSILSKMSPEAARVLTSKLTEQKKLKIEPSKLKS